MVPVVSALILPFPMPYLKDPRGRVTLNFPAADFSALTADAARAGHASPGPYALALVRARGAALRPVMDEHGAQRVARLKAKMAVLREELAAAEAQAATAAARIQILERDLRQRPTRAEYDQWLTEAAAKIAAEQSPVSSPTLAERPRTTRHRQDK